MPSLKTLAALLALTAATLAQNRAIITIATSHGGAGNNITNTTVTVPLNQAYGNRSVLRSVSYLYLTGAIGVPFDSVTCQAYRDRGPAPQQTGGKPFDSKTPALLSTNTVRVGSIVCTSNFVAMAPGGPDYSTSILATGTTSSTKGGRTSTVVTTMSATSSGAGGEQGGAPATVTSVVDPTSSSASPTTGGETQSESATASASPGLTNMGPTKGIGGLEAFAGLAVAWMGMAFAL